MRKAVFTLNINNYAPEIRELTYPLIKHYCHKIGAEFCEITERKNPSWPLPYEKLQIYDLGKDNDWNIFIDADAMVYPDLFDVTEFLPRDTVMHWGMDPANNRWVFDDYFRRDGRNISSAGWFAVASKWCLDLWHPCELTPEEVQSRIFPSAFESASHLRPEHFIDEFVTSRNIAKFGLKYQNFTDWPSSIKGDGNYFWHVYGVPDHMKLEEIKKIITAWRAWWLYPGRVIELPSQRPDVV